MIPLTTPVPVPPSPIKITHSDRILLIGSCFTENISLRLRESGFQVLSNPFGILYNPLSIALCLAHILTDTGLSPDRILERDGRYYSWLHHSGFSAPTREECLERCNRSIHEAHEFVQPGATILLTFGTAWTWFLPDGTPAANCHKMPASTFTRRLLTIPEILEPFSALPLQDHRLILTLSPIRHWADTPHGNQLSKATLMLAIEELCRSPKCESSCYFPAYEILMDELRDYRYYDRDLLHPSPVACDIIWERFQDCHFSAPTLALAKQHQQLHTMQQHRPRFPDSEEARRFEAKIQELQAALGDPSRG